MRVISYFLMLLSTITGFSQQVIDVGKQDVRISSSQFYTIAGNPVSTAKYVRVVSGSPYFNDEWMYGKVELADGHKYDSIKMKIDLIDNSILFINPDGQEMIATASVKTVTLADPVTNRQYDFIFSSFIKPSGDIETGWYEILTEGKATAYKLAVKRINETRPYGSATIEQSINTLSKYFVLVNSTFSPVKKFKDLPDILSDKKDELNKYISSMKLSGRSDNDYADAVLFYNGLTAGKN